MIVAVLHLMRKIFAQQKGMTAAQTVVITAVFCCLLLLLFLFFADKLTDSCYNVGKGAIQSNVIALAS